VFYRTSSLLVNIDLKHAQHTTQTHIIMGALDFLTTTALSATVSGNTGVAPFATLFIVGFLERTDPDLLSMDEWMEKVSSR